MRTLHHTALYPALSCTAVNTSHFIKTALRYLTHCYTTLHTYLHTDVIHEVDPFVFEMVIVKGFLTMLSPSKKLAK